MAASLSVTRSVTDVKNLLLCDICKKTINEPKILPCSHSFCNACLESLLITTQNDENVDGETKTFDCPTCMYTVTLRADESVAGLPDNEFIFKLLTAVGLNRKQERPVCSLGHSEPPITICMECEMLLCHACYCSHDIWPRNKSHTMLSISEITMPDEHQLEHQETGAEMLSCTQHEDTIPTFYCETCMELSCIKCVASIHKKEERHTCVAINEICRKQQEAAKSKRAAINAVLLEGNKVNSVDSIHSNCPYLKFTEFCKVKNLL